VLGAGVWGLGIALTVLVTAIEYLVWGRPAVAAAISFGLVATVISAIAARTLKPGLAGPYADLVRHFAVGMGLRLAGIVLFVVAVVADRTLFPPFPAAFGYLGVVVPLLFVETKLAK
jgi:hypothetical protein